MPEPKPSNPVIFGTGEDFEGVAITGITLRDIFAVAYLVGSEACHTYDLDHGTQARFAYEQADAMLAEREREEESR